MKKLRYFPAVLLLIVLLFASSCEDDNDTQKPQIIVVSPEQNEVLNIGSEIHFDVDFSDNTELKSYKVDIHNNFEGHTHKRANSGDTVAWSFQKSWSFDAGQKNAHVHHHEIEIPHDYNGMDISQGNYHFMIYCLDAAGNETWVAVPVKIMKSVVKSPDESGNVGFSTHYPIVIQ